MYADRPQGCSENLISQAASVEYALTRWRERLAAAAKAPAVCYFKFGLICLAFSTVSGGVA